MFCLAAVFVFPLGLLARRYDVPAAANAAAASAHQPEAAASLAARDESRNREAKTRARLNEAYGKLPLSFEARPARENAPSTFSARGDNYSLYLDATGATLALKRPSLRDDTQREVVPGAKPEAATLLRMNFVGANAAPRISGVGELPGKANYFIGRDAAHWRAGLPTYERVRYESLYPGIDLFFYGNQRKLEYDFVLAPGADPRLIKLDFEGAKRISLAPNGDLVLRTDGGDVRQHRPVVYQEIAGVRREIASRYVLAGGQRVEFRIGKYDRRLPLVIDPVVSYSTFLGGSLAEQGTAIAVDSNGNAYLAGYTDSGNFPTRNPSQTTISGFRDAFVLKLNAEGSALIYSTYLGGSSIELGAGIKLDSGGNAYITGSTFSTDFPTVNPVQAAKGDQTLLFRSADGGNNWPARDNGLANVFVLDLEIMPGAPNVIYAGTDRGVFKSTDGGGNWVNTGGALLGHTVEDVAINPADTSVVFAAADNGLHRSNDAGATWTAVPNVYADQLVAVAPTSPVTIYAGTFLDMLRSGDGGVTWTTVNSNNIFSDTTIFRAIVVDPANASHAYVGTNQGIYKTSNAGVTWSLLTTGIPFFASVLDITPDRINAGVFYAAATSGIYKTSNSGASWSQVGAQSLAGVSVRATVVDPVTPSNVIAATTNAGIYKSTDGGATWAPVATDLRGVPFNALAAAAGAPVEFYAGAGFSSDAYVAKLDATGTSLLYSRRSELAKKRRLGRAASCRSSAARARVNLAGSNVSDT